MASLNFDNYLQFLGPVYTEKFELSLNVYPISIWKGAAVLIDVSEDDGAIQPAEGVTMTSGDVFVGIAAEHAVSVVGQDEPTKMEVYVWPTIVGFPGTALTFADIGKRVGMPDSGGPATTTGAYPSIGRLYTIKDGFAYVLLDPPTVR